MHCPSGFKKHFCICSKITIKYQSMLIKEFRSDFFVQVYEKTIPRHAIKLNRKPRMSQSTCCNRISFSKKSRQRFWLECLTRTVTSIMNPVAHAPVKSCKVIYDLVMRKQAFCKCENKDADQLRSNREADQRLCFRYTDSTIPLLPKSEFLSF